MFMSGARLHGTPPVPYMPGIQPFNDPLLSSVGSSGGQQEHDLGAGVGSIESGMVPRSLTGTSVFPYSLGTKSENSVEGFGHFLQHQGLSLDSPLHPLGLSPPSIHSDDRGPFPPLPSGLALLSGSREESTPNIPPVNFLTPPTTFHPMVVPPVSAVFSPSSSHSVHLIPAPTSPNTPATINTTSATSTAATTTTTTTTSTSDPSATNPSIINSMSDGQECIFLKQEVIDPLFSLSEPLDEQLEARYHHQQLQSQSNLYQTKQNIQNQLESNQAKSKSFGGVDFSRNQQDHDQGERIDGNGGLHLYNQSGWPQNQILHQPFPLQHQLLFQEVELHPQPKQPPRELSEDLPCELSGDKDPKLDQLMFENQLQQQLLENHI
eukprot:TRINITY_DN5698_c0_g1_i10.p1 TRINITY_DN5698_c0_g1~~TRINITY_DN5698_c0_g1_i10.p1  ORF type:complete len:379 (-),score=85.83 TRINITY_DN5698_c0_g1_i10:253-1389(-)